MSSRSTGFKPVAPKPVARKLSEAIDRLGDLRDRVHALKADEQALTATVRDGLRAVKAKTKRAAGKSYEAELVRGARLVIDDLAGLRRAAGGKFLRCVKADVKAARRQLGEDVLGKLGSLEKTEKVCVYKTKPAKAPRRAPTKERVKQ